MAEYGNNFSNNSGNYSFKTSGHKMSDENYVTVARPNNVSISLGNTSDVGNNVTTYGSNYGISYYQTRPSDSLYVAYFTFPENRNTQGSISGEFSCTVGDKYYNEPSSPDDSSRGVSTDGQTLWPDRKMLPFVGTTDTRGYRQASVSIYPRIEFDKASYNNGWSTYSSVNTSSSGDYARQTFLNEKDPKGLLTLVLVRNQDDEKSTSPTFASVSNGVTYYGVNFSYAYNPYNNSPRYQYTTSLNFTYNKLPLYPKTFVMTYGEKYNNISYDGDTISASACTLYNGTYDGFTTSTATDTGFTSYKRSAEFGYTFYTFNSSTTPTRTVGTFRIWQPASHLGLTYTWSIDGSPSWAHLSTTSGNSTVVTLDDQGDYQGEVHGQLQVNGSTTMEASGSTSNTVTGLTWKDKDNKSTRTCTVRSKVDVTNCIAQNVTPKNSSGMPENSFVITQNPAVWENPSITSTFKVTYTNYAEDDNNYISSWYPTVTISGVSSSDGNEHSFTWAHPTTSKDMSVKMISMTTPWISGVTHGVVTLTQDKTSVPNSGGTVTLTATPALYMDPGYHKGYSAREWRLSNVSNTSDVAMINDLKTWNDVTIHMNSRGSFSYTSPITTISWSKQDSTTFNMPSTSLSPTSTTFSAEDKQGAYQGVTSSKSVTLTIGSNYKTAGSWSASGSRSDQYISNGSVALSVKTTSVNKDAKAVTPDASISWNETGDPSIDSKLSTISIAEDKWNGTITFTGSGNGFVKFDDDNASSKSITYPANSYGNATGSTSAVIKGRQQLYVTGAGTLGVSVTSPSSNVPYDGGTIYVSSTGSPTSESSSSKTYNFSISATSSVVSTNPSGGNPVISGTITPYSPNYYYEYKLDSGSWTTSRSLSVGSNSGSITSNTSASLTFNNASDVKTGAFNYTPGHYVRLSTSSKSHTVYVRVVDNNDGDRVYSGGTTSKTQNGDSGSNYYISGSWYIYPSADYHCTVSSSFKYSGDTSSHSNVGSFTVTPSCSTPSSNTGTSSTPSTYIWNRSDTRGYSNPTTACSCSFTGAGEKQYNADETISWSFGVDTSSPDSTTRTGTGSLTWNYMYGYSVKREGETSSHSTGSKVASGNAGTYATATLSRYYRVDGGSWSRLTNYSAKRTLTKTGTFTVEVAWMRSATDSSQSVSGGSASVTIKKYDYQYKLTASGGTTIEHTAFDSNPSSFSLTCTYTCQYSVDNGATWKSATPTFSWSGATSTTASASVTVSAGSSATDGNTKTVICTISYGGKTASTTWYLKNYGKTYCNS